ncbi:DUF4382 domain-containing protein [Marinimicrobium sp. ABcell2]|uniref:DUF4382 domain-containing protein n=1 Tax=Marinimicrobium sp. ABcell2 TaxID=3069751 RepID=UPI0027B630FB|nr:DUF4382 domain-containing protein [Marinimicrobium sp. ABcell2]MDQ2075745.1 DUF4382 domain-containing protein [Marinimicrobium sp. ABcell2]
MTTYRKYLTQLVLAAFCAALVACGGSDPAEENRGSDTDSSNDTGSFTLDVTDAAVDLASQVVVEFSGVSIKPAAGDVVTFEFDQAMSIDLLALQGSASQNLVANAEVPAGDYEWIELHVNAENDGVLDSYVELKTGNVLELSIPSGAQSGLRLVSGFTVNAGGHADFTVDVDLRKSIILPPTNILDGALFRPALRLIDNTTSGTVTGEVESELLTAYCEDPANQAGAVYVFSGADASVSDVRGSDSDPLTTALVNYEDGEYRYEVGFLAEGEYTLAYTCDAYKDDPEHADSLTFVGETNVSVQADAETELNFTSESEASSGTMSMDITDAPVDSANKVVVQFDGVVVGSSSDSGRKIIEFDEPVSLDLLTLQGQNSASLFTHETLAAGVYEYIQLMITAEANGELTSYIEYEDGTQAELFIPSGGASGLKLHGPFHVEAGESHEFVVDFDLRKSVHYHHSMHSAILRPALRIVDKASATHIRGEVEESRITGAHCSTHAAVYVFEGSDAQPDELGSDNEPLTSALVQATANGGFEYEVGFLAPGDYTLALTCQADLDDPEYGNDGIVFEHSANVSLEAHIELELNIGLQ